MSSLKGRAFCPPCCWQIDRVGSPEENLFETWQELEHERQIREAMEREAVDFFFPDCGRVAPHAGWRAQGPVGQSRSLHDASSPLDFYVVLCWNVLSNLDFRPKWSLWCFCFFEWPKSTYRLIFLFGPPFRYWKHGGHLRSKAGLRKAAPAAAAPAAAAPAAERSWRSRRPCWAQDSASSRSGRS